MSDDPTGLILSAIAGLRADVQADMAARLADLRADVQADMAAKLADLRADVQADMAARLADLRADVQADMAARLADLRADVQADMAARLADLRADVQAEVAGLRAEFMALRTNLLAQSERVLNEVAALRDDMTVVMARLDRMDATVHGCVTEVRALHRQISRIAARVTELEQR